MLHSACPDNKHLFYTGSIIANEQMFVNRKSEHIFENIDFGIFDRDSGEFSKRGRTVRFFAVNVRMTKKTGIISLSFFPLI